MITTYLLGKGINQTGGLELLEQWRSSSQGVMWLDIQLDGHKEEEVVQLLKHLNCHPLAITDVMRKRHPPKLEMFSDHIFLLYRGVSKVVSSLEFKHQQVGFFIGSNYLITVHPQPSLGIEKVLAMGEAALERFCPLGLALNIVHSSAGIYLEQVLSFEGELADMEDRLYSDKSEAVLADLARSKADLIKLKRMFNYQCTVFQDLRQLPQDQLPINCQGLEHQITDVAERSERLYSLCQMHYDICGDMMEGYISITSHQMNISMRVLTVVTVVFVPLTFLAGIYGMNFQFMPELAFKFSYPAVIALMVVIASILIVMFKRKKWF